MKEFSIIMFIFGILIILVGLYLKTGKKGDFTSMLLWKSNVKKMTKEQISYAGKVTMFTGLSPIVTGLVGLFIDESIIPVIVLISSFVLFLIIAIKLFK